MRTFWHSEVEYREIDTGQTSRVGCGDDTKEGALSHCYAHVGFYTQPGYLVTKAVVAAKCAACENEGTVWQAYAKRQGGRRVVCPECKGKGPIDVTTLINLDGGHSDILRGYNHCHQGTPWGG